ncbi:kelch-like protein 40b isoform X2 [Cylas formicarius]|uniref:kelch-like protein 40b isoform X2 n=1 Tax=Cylas formicarius TaxID=197179 RepID=UPI0029585BF8|nr:kelch-like protein 40b isoform X2 [Cylas formicarius]XP_060524200.1 kelch-like protein 40b isoform X2 [Cylas formicarius]
MEEICLEIEGVQIQYKKSDLIEHSDYFNAMFNGNFLESSQTTVKLEGVDLKSMNIILTLLWDGAYIIQNEDLLLVLQTSCMLQFTKIRKLCEDRILEILAPSNCLKIWILTERLDITPLYLKAKCMALEEFNEICDSDPILELSLKEICMYLGHINLRTDCEFRVFQTIMRWWYENCKAYELEKNETIVKLLHCLNFKRLTDDNVREMKTYPDISTNSGVVDILNCFLSLRQGLRVDEYPQASHKHACSLSQSKGRKSSDLPCLIFEAFDYSSTNEEEMVLIRDRFHRKRHLTKVLESTSNSSKKKMLFGMLYDPAINGFTKLIEIDGKKCKDLTGFSLTAYKEFVLIYGGEFLIGGGNWNNNIWVFDTFRERWERKHQLPHGRRHFESCKVGHRLYIIAGIGRFRIIQDNLIYYDFKTDQWSNIKALPSPSQQIKCCNFRNQLFILCSSTRLGYLLDSHTENWRVLKILVKNEDIYLENLKLPVSIFSWKGKLFIKGQHLLGFDLEDETFIEMMSLPFNEILYEDLESTVCDDVVYTLYKVNSEIFSVMYTLESFNLERGILKSFQLGGPKRRGK